MRVILSLFFTLVFPLFIMGCFSGEDGNSNPTSNESVNTKSLSIEGVVSVNSK